MVPSADTPVCIIGPSAAIVYQGRRLIQYRIQPYCGSPGLSCTYCPQGEKHSGHNCQGRPYTQNITCPISLYAQRRGLQKIACKS